jgi:hypothetical protein
MSDIAQGGAMPRIAFEFPKDEKKYYEWKSGPPVSPEAVKNSLPEPQDQRQKSNN